MHRTADTTTPRAPRTLTALALAAACAVTLTGCSGPSPEDQREVMVTVTTDVIAQMVYLLEMSEPQVLDDGSEPVECAGGERYQYVAYGATEFDAGNDVMDDRLDSIGGFALGGVPLGSEGGAYFTRADTIELDLNGDGPRQVVAYADRGPNAGATLVIDYLPGQGSEVLLRFAGTTVCG